MNEAGITPLTYWTLQNDRVELTDAGVIDESLVNIYVNGQNLVALMCSPLEQEALAIGFLFNEGVIDSMDEIEHIQTNVAHTVVDVFLKNTISLLMMFLLMRMLPEHWPSFSPAMGRVAHAPIIFIAMRSAKSGSSHLMPSSPVCHSGCSHIPEEVH